MDFSARLKKWRMQHKMTQPQAAQWLDVPHRTYEQWEQGRQEPSQVGPILKLLETKKVEPKKK